MLGKSLFTKVITLLVSVTGGLIFFVFWKMGTWESLSIKVVSLFTATIVGLFVYVSWKTDSLRHQRSFSLAAPGGKVTVQINKHGVAHIESASSDYDTFYALGYLHARDRFWQIELQRHLVAGRLSEVFGKVTIDQDKYVRTWGLYRAAKRNWQHFDERTKTIIDHYTQGINAYIDNNKLPLQALILRHKIAPWTLTDSHAWSKMISWQLQNTWQDKINNHYLREQYGEHKMDDISPKYPPDAPTIIGEKSDFDQVNSPRKSPLTNISMSSFFANPISALMSKTSKFNQAFNFNNFPGKGSNSWVLSGEHTESGLPLMANDLHLMLSSPNTWYMTNLKSPNLHIEGATMPGMPMVFAGHNYHVAWSITDAAIDSQEVYLVDSSHAITTIKEVIHVKNADDVVFDIEVTDDGPVINPILDADGSLPDTGKIVVKWTALDERDITVQSFLKVNYATDWSEFKQALSDYVAPPQNFLYADVDGNIGYYLPGKIPVRDGWSGRYPVPLDELHQWQDYIPFDDMPHLFNPDSGVIATANNKAVTDSYLHQLTYQWRGMPYRIQRINDQLTVDAVFSVDDIVPMQIDVYCRFWEQISPYLLNVLPLRASSRQALAILQQWNGHAGIDSVGATVFAFWLKELMTIQPRPPGTAFVIENPLFLLQQLKTDGQFCVTEHYKNSTELLLGTLDRCVDKLTQKLGSDPRQWLWGNIHKAVLDDFIFKGVPVLNRIWKRSVPSPGLGYTVNTGSYDDNYLQIAGATYRQIIDLSCFANNLYMMPLGQSGNPLSKHYDDLLLLWSNGQYISMRCD